MADRRDTSHASHHSDSEDGGGTHALSADVVGILDTVDVPIVVISRECTLVRFNRAATDAFGVGSSDIGRHLSGIAALADAQDLGNYCAQVMADDVPIRRDMISGDRRFLLRIASYARESGRSVGGSKVSPRPATCRPRRRPRERRADTGGCSGRTATTVPMRSALWPATACRGDRGGALVPLPRRVRQTVSLVVGVSLAQPRCAMLRPRTVPFDESPRPTAVMPPAEG